MIPPLPTLSAGGDSDDEETVDLFADVPSGNEEGVGSLHYRDFFDPPREWDGDGDGVEGDSDGGENGDGDGVESDGDGVEGTDEGSLDGDGDEGSGEGGEKQHLSSHERRQLKVPLTVVHSLIPLKRFVPGMNEAMLFTVMPLS